MPADAKRLIRRVTQSPMNPVIWFLDLECGHELRVVQKARPRTYSVIKGNESPRRILCPVCDGRRV